MIILITILLFMLMSAIVGFIMGRVYGPLLKSERQEALRKISGDKL